MKLVGIISTAVLSMSLGATAPVYAQQEQHDQQKEQQSKPAQQDEKKTQPARQAQKAPQQRNINTKQAQKAPAQPNRNGKQPAVASQQQNNQAKGERAAAICSPGNLRLGNPRSRPGPNLRDDPPTKMTHGAFPTTVSAPSLDRSIDFISAKPITAGTAAFNTVAIGSDSLIPGHPTGSTRKMFLWSTLMVSITCATQPIPGSTSRSTSNCNGASAQSPARTPIPSTVAARLQYSKRT